MILALSLAAALSLDLRAGVAASSGLGYRPGAIGGVAAETAGVVRVAGEAEIASEMKLSASGGHTWRVATQARVGTPVYLGLGYSYGGYTARWEHQEPWVKRGGGPLVEIGAQGDWLSGFVRYRWPGTDPNNVSAWFLEGAAVVSAPWSAWVRGERVMYEQGGRHEHGRAASAGVSYRVSP